MRVLSLGLLALIAAARLASAGETDADDEPVMYATCRDGQRPTPGGLPCDIDGRVDGSCTFGEEGGKSVPVPVGRTVRVENSCGAVAELTCRGAR